MTNFRRSKIHAQTQPPNQPHRAFPHPKPHSSLQLQNDKSVPHSVHHQPSLPPLLRVSKAVSVLTPPVSATTATLGLIVALNVTSLTPLPLPRLHSSNLYRLSLHLLWLNIQIYLFCFNPGLNLQLNRLRRMGGCVVSSSTLLALILISWASSMASEDEFGFWMTPSSIFIAPLAELNAG